MDMNNQVNLVLSGHFCQNEENVAISAFNLGDQYLVWMKSEKTGESRQWRTISYSEGPFDEYTGNHVYKYWLNNTPNSSIKGELDSIVERAKDENWPEWGRIALHSLEALWVMRDFHQNERDLHYMVSTPKGLLTIELSNRSIVFDGSQYIIDLKEAGMSPTLMEISSWPCSQWFSGIIEAQTAEERGVEDYVKRRVDKYQSWLGENETVLDSFKHRKKSEPAVTLVFQQLEGRLTRDNCRIIEVYKTYDQYIAKIKTDRREWKYFKLKTFDEKELTSFMENTRYAAAMCPTEKEMVKHGHTFLPSKPNDYISLVGLKYEVLSD
jgi:hypothetical protein